MGRSESRFILGQLISLFDKPATISSSRPGCGWPRRAVIVKGGRRPSRSDMPLTVTSTAAGWLRRAWHPLLATRRARSTFQSRRLDDSEGSSPSGANIAPQTCIRSILSDRNHDAVMRISGEAPRRRAHSKSRFEDHVQSRVAVTSDRLSAARHPVGERTAENSVGLACPTHHAERSLRPTGASPVIANRHSAMRSLRARATIMALRVPPRASAVRTRYHSARVLSL